MAFSNLTQNHKKYFLIKEYPKMMMFSEAKKKKTDFETALYTKAFKTTFATSPVTHKSNLEVSSLIPPAGMMGRLNERSTGCQCHSLSTVERRLGKSYFSQNKNHALVAM